MEAPHELDQLDRSRDPLQLSAPRHNPTPNTITGGRRCQDLLNQLIFWETMAARLAGKKRELKLQEDANPLLSH